MDRLLPFRDSIDARFAAFHAENPQLFVEFRKIAGQLLDNGHTRLAADGILHWIRIERLRTWEKSDGWKVNNDFTALYARELMKEPRFAGKFETRKRRAS